MRVPIRRRCVCSKSIWTREVGLRLGKPINGRFGLDLKYNPQSPELEDRDGQFGEEL